MIGRGFAVLNMHCLCGFGVLRRPVAPLAAKTAIPVKDTHELSQLHDKLRTATTPRDFIQTFRASEELFRGLGMLLVMEVASENIYNWTLDDELITVISILDQAQLTIHQRVLKLRVIGQIRERLQREEQKRWSNCRSILNSSMTSTINYLNECCVKNELSMGILGTYMDALYRNSKFPIQPVHLMDRYLGSKEQVPARYILNFSRYIANISWRQVVGCQHIMHYMLYNISQEIEVLPLSQQIMIFQNVAMMRLHIFSYEQRLSTLTEVMKNKLLQCLNKLDSVETLKIINAYAYLPLSFSNELLEKVIARSSEILEGHFEFKHIKFLNEIPFKRLDNKVYKDLIQTIRNQLESGNASFQIVCSCALTPVIKQQMRPLLIKLIKQQIKIATTLTRLNARHTGGMVQLFSLLDHEHEWTEDADKIINDIVFEQECQNLSASLAGLLISTLVQRKKKLGTTKYDATITALCDFFETNISKIHGPSRIIGWMTYFFRDDEPMLEKVHKKLYTLLSDCQFSLFWSLPYTGAERILEMAKQPCFETFKIFFSNHYDSNAVHHLPALLEKYCEVLEKTREQSSFVFSMMNRYQDILKKHQFVVLVTLLTTPVACMFSSKGLLDPSLEEFLHNFVFQNSQCHSTAAVMKCLRLLKSVDAPVESLFRAFLEKIQDPASVQKLQIKQLLLALQLLFSREDNFAREHPDALKVCLPKLESFLETPNVSLKLRAECLWRYLNITEILDNRNKALVEKVAHEIISRNASLEEKDMSYPMWMMLYLEAKRQVKMHPLEKEGIILRIKGISASDNMTAAMLLLPELKKTYYHDKGFPLIKGEIIPLIEQSIKSTINHYSLSQLLALYEIGLIYHNKPIIDEVGELICRAKLSSRDSYSICMLLSTKRDTNEKLLNKIAKDIMNYNHSYMYNHKLQIIFMFAKNFYKLPSKYMECVKTFLKDLEYETAKKQLEVGRGLVWKLYARYYLNYLWSVLVLQLPRSELAGFKICLEAFEENALENCKNTTNRYLLGMTADIFLMLYKEPGTLKPAFIEAMLKNKQLWSKTTEFEGKFPRHQIPSNDKAIEKFQQDGLVVDYYLPESKKAILLLHSYYLTIANEETGFSKMRDLIVGKVLANPQIVKVVANKSKSPFRKITES